MSPSRWHCLIFLGGKSPLRPRDTKGPLVPCTIESDQLHWGILLASLVPLNGMVELRDIERIHQDINWYHRIVLFVFSISIPFQTCCSNVFHGFRMFSMVFLETIPSCNSGMEWVAHGGSPHLIIKCAMELKPKLNPSNDVWHWGFQACGLW